MWRADRGLSDVHQTPRTHTWPGSGSREVLEHQRHLAHDNPHLILVHQPLPLWIATRPLLVLALGT